MSDGGLDTGDERPHVQGRAIRGLESGIAVQGDHRHTVAGKPEDRSEFGMTTRGSGAPEQHHLGSVRPVHPDGWNAVEVFGEVTVVHHQTTSVGELLGE